MPALSRSGHADASGGVHGLPPRASAAGRYDTHEAHNAQQTPSRISAAAAVSRDRLTVDMFHKISNRGSASNRVDP